MLETSLAGPQRLGPKVTEGDKYGQIEEFPHEEEMAESSSRYQGAGQVHLAGLPS